MEHYFISYSRADGEEFARRLADALAPLPTWRDGQLRAGEAWDFQLAEAIAQCKALLFLMTPDSVREASFCKTEWAYALKYKKPVIPLRMHRDAELPFRLVSWQYHDFTTGFAAAATKLSKYLDWLDTPAGQLHLVEQRILDAEETGAHGYDPRLAAELKELRRQREQWRRIVDDPEAAERRMQAKVAKGQERERAGGMTEPSLPVPPHFQNRFDESVRIGEFLDDESRRLMIVVGRGGIGKSALVGRVLQPVSNVVHLSNAQSTHRVTLPDLYANLVSRLPEEAAARVDAVYRDPKSSARQTMEALTQAFARVRTIVLLDNFEEALDPETARIRDTELDEALRALLELPPHGLKVILTTRVVPHALMMVQPQRQQRLDVDSGLESPYAEQILRQLDDDGKLGLRDAPEALLAAARERTLGHPRALELLYGILVADRDTTLEEILDTTSGLLPDDVVQALVGDAFSRLDALAQRVMQALAVYREPVPPRAVDHLLRVESAAVLKRLVNMHFARGERKHYSLHPVDREYALSRVDPEALRKLRLGAAEWFAGTRKPPEAWKTLDDLAPQLAEFDLRCDAGDYDTAATLLFEIGRHLSLWGHHQLMMESLRRLQGKVASPELATHSMAILAGALFPLGKLDEATELYEKAIAEARRHALPTEAVMLVDLAGIALARFDLRAAIELFQRAGTRMRELDQYYGVHQVTVYQANVLLQLGKPEEARERVNDALELVRTLEDRQSEAAHLCVLAAAQISLGELDHALRSCEQSLVIATDLGFRHCVAGARTFMATIHILREEWTDAERAIDEALAIADDVGTPDWQKLARETAAMLALFGNELARARARFEAASRCDSGRPAPYSSALGGVIALRQSDVATAQQFFRKAIAEANQLLAMTPQLYLAHDALGFAYCGLALCGDRGKIADARTAFRNARAITAHAGTVRAVVLLFDALAQADTEGILAEVRPFAAGTASA